MATPVSSNDESGLRRSTRIAFVAILWLLTGCILIQAYLAGQAAMIDRGLWQTHVAFVKAFAPLTILLFLLAWASGRSWVEKRWALATFVFIALQFFSAEARAWPGFSWFPGLHAIGAMGLCVSCVILCVLNWPGRRG